MSYAVVDTNGLVVNVVIWDGVTDFQVPSGMSLVELPYETRDRGDGVEVQQYLAGIGWTYDGTDWIAPPAEDEELV